MRSDRRDQDGHGEGDDADGDQDVNGLADSGAYASDASEASRDDDLEQVLGERQTLRVVWHRLKLEPTCPIRNCLGERPSA